VPRNLVDGVELQVSLRSPVGFPLALLADGAFQLKPDCGLFTRMLWHFGSHNQKRSVCFKVADWND